jgi:hypothetical protein
MVKYWTMMAIAVLPRRAAVSSSLIGLTVALAGSGVGCGPAPSGQIEGMESVGAVAQADGSIIGGVNQYEDRIDLALNHQGYDSYWNVQWGLMGSKPKVSPNYTGTFSVYHPTVGGLYNFAAQDCAGVPWTPWAGSCSEWSPGTSAFYAHKGTNWAYAPNLSGDWTSTAYYGGYYTANSTLNQLPLCSGYVDKGMYPGYWANNTCNIGLSGSVHTDANAYVLTSLYQSATWAPLTAGHLPASAVPLGYDGANSLYACRTPYLDGYLPGWTAGTGCNYAHENTCAYADGADISVLSL